MLKQEELAFLKAISAARQSPVFLWQLKKAMAANKAKRAVASSKASTSAGASTHRQHVAGKRKARQLCLDISGEPATRRPVPEPAYGRGPRVSPATGWQAA